MPDFDLLVSKAKGVCRFPVNTDGQSTPKALLVHAEDILTLCEMFHKDPECYFDQLSCLTGLDNGVEAGTMEVAYNLYSIPYHTHLMIKVSLPRDTPELSTVSSVWKTADWHEREAYDLLGIRFVNHPDLRRILLPADWEGFPLRKDYHHQEYYRGIKVEY